MTIASTTRRTIAAASLAVLALALPTSPAHASDEAESVVVQGQLAADGTLGVQQTVTFADKAPSQLSVQLDTTRENTDGSHDVMTIDKVTASSAGKDLPVSTGKDGDAAVIRVDASGATGKDVVIGYSVRGATRAIAANGRTPAGVEFEWPLLQGLSVSTKKVSGTVKPPATITYVDCKSGPVGSLQPCATFQAGQYPHPDPSFTDGPRAAGEQVVLSFGQPGDAVAVTEQIGHRWSLERAFSITPGTLAGSLLPLLFGSLALWALHRRSGRDLVDASRITPIAEFRPVGVDESVFTVLDDVRPGHVGTVADERVDPVDVTATVLDLASRGWIRIVELERDDQHQALDWVFHRREDGTGELCDFERTLRDAIAPQDRPGAQVSTIAASVGPVIGAVQSQLYDDVVARGWFERRPDQTRSKWSTIGWGALVLSLVDTLVLASLTTWGLVGLALIGLSVALLFVGEQMPRRTASGAALLGGLAGLASQLRTQPTHLMPKGRELTELSRVLPYAVVLGGKDRWLQALVDADDDDTPDGTELDWYHAPETWHLRHLPGSLDAFVVMMQGQLFGRR